MAADGSRSAFETFFFAAARDLFEYPWHSLSSRYFHNLPGLVCNRESCPAVSTPEISTRLCAPTSPAGSLSSPDWEGGNGSIFAVTLPALSVTSLRPEFSPPRPVFSSP